MKNILFIILSLTISCKQAKEKKNNKKNYIKIEETKREFKLPKSWYTIIQYNHIEMYCFTENVNQTKLSQNELIEIEKIIEQAVEENNKNNEIDYILKLEIMKRQYVPVINNKGEKIIWINFFCDDEDMQYGWEKYIIEVNDGGNCYFNLKINLTKKKYFDLSINGYA